LIIKWAGLSVFFLQDVSVSQQPNKFTSPETCHWGDVLASIKNQVPSPTYNRWFRPLSARTFSNNAIELVADDEFDAVFIEKNFSAFLQLHLKRIIGHKVSVSVIHESNSVSDIAPGFPASSSLEEEKGELCGKDFNERVIKAGLRQQYSFGNFVVGPNSEFAFAATSAVSNSIGKLYNPLFLYGRVGLGKTHLINAVGLDIIRNNPNATVLYRTAEGFMNEMIHHIRNNQMDAFRARYRDGVDALLIDDIQFLSGKESTQREFFHTFNALHQTGVQVIITADQFPHEIPDIEERLRSRFQWGLIADIQSPSKETRMAILKQKAEALHLRLENDVAFFMAERISSNVRELEGALLRLHAFSSFNGQQISVSLAERLLGQTVSTQNRIPSIERIQREVSRHYKISVSALTSASRERSISFPRQVAMFLSKALTNESYPRLGEKFGGRDHTTVLASYRKIDKLLETDIELNREIISLKRRLGVRI
jgi:chromosomal replication initiator protein